ncbi:class F sortase [Nocardioides zeae]|uniref:Class F sortase n=1 Tax=Nocardioides imazamoxiresistens TaxID=3231893 RepID=A0ABU3PRD8_9ACTN|nr:class F sortase [Nocardioides zeae]MDT9591790.1 class F sortase [Nocardioides zeae]
MTRPASRRRRRAAAVAVVAAVLLAGCGGGGGDSGDGAAGSDDAPAPTSSGSAAPGVTAESSDGTPEGTGDGDEPVRVEIPAIGVDEAPIDLGTAANGELEVPEDPDRVGWFTGGGRPGGRGPTVVVGHLDAVDGPAVFADLPDLVAGDEVVVTTADGTAVRYVVDRTEDVPQDEFPTTAVFGATPDDQLRLITCTGPYDRAIGRYTENRVVYASPA